MAGKRRVVRNDDNKAGKTCIKIILIVFIAVMSVQIYKVYQKDQEKIAQQQALEEQLKYEENRKKELEEYEEYIGTIEYVEDMAQSKLGLLYENQIIFREKKE